MPMVVLQVRICDRCGAWADQKYESEILDEAYNYVQGKRGLSKGVVGECAYLCESCKNEFEKWWFAGKSKAERKDTDAEDEEE